MDLSGANVFSVVRSGSAEEKHTVLQELKTHVKKDNVLLPWVGKYFEALSIATDSPDTSLQTLAFSLLCHLVKRVSIQDSRGTVLLDQTFLVLPLLIPRIADSRSSVKVSARRALEAYWLSCPKPVELAMVEIGLANRSLLLVNECVAWLNYILTNVSPHFKLDTFLDPLARILCEHASDEKLVSNIKVLLENYYDLKQNRIRKFELQKALERSRVPSVLRFSIMGTDSIISRTSELLYHSKSTPSLPHSQMAKPTVARPSQNSPSIWADKPSVNSAGSRFPESPPPNQLIQSAQAPGVSSEPALRDILCKLPNYAYDETVESFNVSNAGEISQMVSEMSQCFENKETERNWSTREKSILKLRSLLRGNAANEYLSDLIISIKELSEGICKSLSSLRTTLSVNSCQFVKEMAFLFRIHFEPLVDLFVPTLIKLCSNTKHLTNINAHVAMCGILTHCPLSAKLGQRILHAASEKSVNTKAFASSWLQIFIVRTHNLWRGSGSEIVERVLLKLLPDPNMQVRLAAKDAFWKYCEYAEEPAVNLRSQLDPNINRALERSRPKGITISAAPVTTNSKVRPSLKESIMAKKREFKNKTSESRSVSKYELTGPNGSFTESSVSSNFPRRMLRTPSFKDHMRSRDLTPTSHIHEAKSIHDRFLDKGAAKIDNTTQGKVLPESHWEHKIDESITNISGSKQQVTTAFQSNAREAKSMQQPKSYIFGAGDPMFKFLASTDEQLLQEGISLLRSALLKGEEISESLTPLLKKLSINNPSVLAPLFDNKEGMLRRVFKLLTKEDFLRLACVLVTPTQENLDMVISLFTADELYLSLETLLLFVLEPTDVADDGLLIMQLIKFKVKILIMVLRLLSRAATSLPMTDVMLTKLANTLFELLPVIHQTNMMAEFKEPLSKLYAINSTLFASHLSLVKDSSRRELELLVGIDDLLSFKSTDPTMFNMTDFTRISPNKNLEQLSPLKFPSDFTMLLPNTKVKAEPDTHPEESQISSQGSHKVSITDVSAEQRICLEDPPQMQLVPEEDILMEDFDENHSENNPDDESMSDCNIRDPSEEKTPQTDGAVEVKLETADFNVLKKSSPHTSLSGAAVKDLNELVKDFASVKLTSQANTIETFIEKVDPLNKLSSRNRPIAIYDDSKAGSPQKVKEYDFTELNWFNFLMAKMSLDYGLDDLERYYKNDFRSLCQKLSDGSANENCISTLIKYLRVPDPESLASFLQDEGYDLVENAAIDYLSLDDSNLFEGLMVIKQLLVSRHAVNVVRVWNLLLDLSGMKPDEPLRALELAVGETFDEMLCGMYASKELIQIVTHTLKTNVDLAGGALRFALESLHKLVHMETLVLDVNADIVMSIDGAVRRLVSHDRAEIRKLVIETYGRIHRAAKISQGSGSQDTLPHEISSEEAVQKIMLALTTPQQRIIEYFSQEK
ncbi:hypothetical protein METBIDRAFT_69932 [Metschnikowia bicuspidata var. bicuspidata NRRL YB-4993]|uniref:Protein STU1 n=1 Tax=Metschnikowia bicuspidata var. bicuspidata NRRL YB-4993 TaxID=869754 RepID=A0A1A0HBZ2_9ASCO|nr:hypothetical protein METBIDRAFT_69932 [Metschnikowia bicuspidata var. bicuspidata NRRL YB-4993]OBA21408.1 hypothetical protein METBIDRAFT_69932 [Metschnikowia bicuspidata var. bicuspidata NRRL YB-4993]